MIAITDPVEALFLLARHALIVFGGSDQDEDFIRNWARWTIEETRDLTVENLLGAAPLHLIFSEEGVDVRGYDLEYGAGVGAQILESVRIDGETNK